MSSTSEVRCQRIRFFCYTALPVHLTKSRHNSLMEFMSEATTILRWNKQELRKYLGRHEALKHTFDLILTADLIYKLHGMDQDGPEIVNSHI